MKLPKAVQAILGEAGVERLQKAIVKTRVRAAVDPLEYFLPLVIAPRAILAWLVKEIKPIKVGGYKDIKFPGRDDMLIHVEKQDIDVYKAEFITGGRIVHSFDKQTLPAMATHMMTTGELYEQYASGAEEIETGEVKSEEPKPMVVDRNEMIDEHESLVGKLKEKDPEVLDEEAEEQESELEDYKAGGGGLPSISVVHAMLGNELDTPKDAETAKWFYAHQNVKELTGVIGKLVDALVNRSQPTETAEKGEMKSNNAPSKPFATPKNPEEGALKPKNMPRLEWSRIVNRHNKKHPDSQVKNPPVSAPTEKAEKPSGAGAPKQPKLPQIPKPPVPAGKAPAAAAQKQAQASARGEQVKPPTASVKAPTAPKAPGALKPPTLKAEIGEKTEDFVPPSKTYFKKKLEKLGKTERGMPITETEVLAPCQHCGAPEFTKSETGFDFTPCYCFRAGQQIAHIAKSENGELQLIFHKGVDEDTKFAFLTIFKQQLVSHREKF